MAVAKEAYFTAACNWGSFNKYRAYKNHPEQISDKKSWIQYPLKDIK
jgi:hypothetical protein